MTAPFVSRLARFVFRWRWPLSAFAVVGALAFAPSADFMTLDNDLTAWFEPDDPAYVQYERMRREFGGTRNLIVAIEGDGIFTPQGLTALRRISRALERVDTVDRVEGLATANIVEALPEGQDADGGIQVRPLVEEPIDQAAADRIRARALGDRLFRGDLVSDDGRATALVISFDEDRIEEVRARVIQQIHGVVDPALPPGLRAHYNGSLEISETYNRVTLANTRQLTPVIFVLMLAGLYVMFRSLSRMLLLFVAIFVSVMWTMGLYALLGFSYNVLTSMLPALIVVLAVADDVHIVQHFEHELRETRSHERAFISSIEHLFAPLLAASATTALGLLSLATSNIASVREFGIGSAIGVMVDFAISLVLVPHLLQFVEPMRQAPPQERLLVRPLLAVARIAANRRGTVLGVAAVLALVAAAGITKLRVDTNHINFFPDGHPLHESAEVMDEKLSGVYSFQVMLEGPADSLKAPDALARMERLAAALHELRSVRKVTSLADYVKRVHRELHGGRPEAEALPGSAEAIAQELFVFGLSDQGRAELERIVASDFSRAQITVRMASTSSDIVFEEIDRAERLAADVFAGSGITTTVTGSGRLWAELDHYMVTSQLSSFATAFVTVFAVTFLVFRSMRFGALAVVANTFPVLIVLGFMGWLDISLNVATVMVASVTLGIVDDDTIHFINRYRHEAAAGATTREAIETATSHEGRASLTTAVINTMGFGVLLHSEYLPSAWFGGLLGLTMAVAFLSEVFIVPAVITLLPRVFATDRIAARLARI